MKCFNHNERDALGTCKHCSKGLCKECLTDMVDGLACRNQCEDAVAYLNEMTQKVRTLHAESQAMVRKTDALVDAQRRDGAPDCA